MLGSRGEYCVDGGHVLTGVDVGEHFEHFSLVLVHLIVVLVRGLALARARVITLLGIHVLDVFIVGADVAAVVCAVLVVALLAVRKT
jgi:hypothetical protein